jgi:hypothetical protein
MQRILADYPTVKKFDLAAQFCDDKRCTAMQNGELLYRDEDHLSLAGAQHIAPGLVDVILSRP